MHFISQPNIILQFTFGAKMSIFRDSASNFLASNLLFCCEELLLNLYWIQSYTPGNILKIFNTHQLF